MCDTIVALGNTTKDGSVLFAKNSDRHPNEPHLMIRIPRRKNSLNKEQLTTTYIKIPQVAETYEVLLLKPSWIWGCEMGCNEFGLNIGNEGVFTKEKYSKVGLGGMDMARIALERCQTSEEAVAMITDFLCSYGQGGNHEFEKDLIYHNSYLIADKQSAWVLETAGQYWVAKKVSDFYCISNGLTIEDDFDKAHPDVIKHAIDKGWCRNALEFNFRKCYSDQLGTYLTEASKRRNYCRSILDSEKGNITVDTIKRILRAHDAKIEGKQFSHSSRKSICMHAGGLIDNHHTTGSYIASLQEKSCTYWVTGASTPCVSIYKPVWLVNGAPLFSEQDKAAAIEYWRVRENVHRLIIAEMVDMNWYFEERDKLEVDFQKLLEKCDVKAASEEKLGLISQEIFQSEAKFMDRVLKHAEISGKRARLNGNWYFNYYWKEQNRNLKKVITTSDRL